MASRAEDRYVKLETKILPSGRVVYKSSRPRVVIVDTVNDIILTANEKDRFDVLANNVYGSAQDWWKIAAANKHVNGSLHMLPNLDIIIPKRVSLK
jgi:hypothetical protein